MKPETEGPTAVTCCGRIFPCNVTSFCATAMAAAVSAAFGGFTGCRRPRHTTTPTASRKYQDACRHRDPLPTHLAHRLSRANTWFSISPLVYPSEPR